MRRSSLSLRLVVLAALCAALVLAGGGAALAYAGETHVPTEPGHVPNTEPAGYMPGEEQHMFSDAVGHWYEDYAENMADHGFMSGFADGTFGGDHNITRGQFAGIMARMMGVEPGEGPAFADCKGFWGAGYVAAMAERGIIKGRQDGTFGPYDPVTRAQMAAMMDRAWEYMHDGLTAEEMEQLREQMRQMMSDATGHWAEDHIGHMYGMGVMLGDGEGHFNPDAHANRAQASAMMWRWFEVHEQQQ